MGGMIADIVNTYSRIVSAAPTLLPGWNSTGPTFMRRSSMPIRKPGVTPATGLRSPAATTTSSCRLRPGGIKRQIAWGSALRHGLAGNRKGCGSRDGGRYRVPGPDGRAGSGSRSSPPPGREGAGDRGDGWTDVSGGQVETQMPYTCRLPSGGSPYSSMILLNPRYCIRPPALRRTVCRGCCGLLGWEAGLYIATDSDSRPPPQVRGDGARLRSPHHREDDARLTVGECSSPSAQA